MPGTPASNLHTLFHSILKTLKWVKILFYSTDKETKV